MATYKTGNLWREHHDLTCITTNNVITRAGLVMGAGIAKTAVEQHPNIDLRQLAATTIRASGQPSEYGFLPLPEPAAHLALFQTKRHFRDPSDLNLIRQGVDGLRAYAHANPTQTIALPFPGIGFGGLHPNTVQPLLVDLPDNVIVWRLR